MPRLVPADGLDEAADRLRHSADRLEDVGRELARAVDTMRWEGRGARRWRERHDARARELAAALDALTALRRELRGAADDVRAEARRIERAERAYDALRAARAVPHGAAAPPPPGDVRWPDYLRGLVGGAA